MPPHLLGIVGIVDIIKCKEYNHRIPRSEFVLPCCLEAHVWNSRVYQTRLPKKIRKPRSPFSEIEKRTFVIFFALHCFGVQKTRRRLALSEE
jgi:hypothetical protein